MRIELAGLENGKGRFAHAYAPDELVFADERVRLLTPPAVSGEIRLAGRRAHVTGRLAATVQVECDRCLKPVDLPVESRFALEYVTPADYQAQQVLELTERDLDLSTFDGETIDIDELVGAELRLAVPDQVLCNESCKGLCSQCRVDRNTVACDCQTAEVDPRWAGLKELVNGK
jgi:DUF177 domain-containing protein